MTPKQLKAARAKLGMTQQALANRLRRNISTLQSWEAGGDCKTSAPVPHWAADKVNEMLRRTK